MKKALLLLSLLISCHANACALLTYYWPIPFGYRQGAVDFNSIVHRQVMWDGKSDIAFNINPVVKNIQLKIDDITEHLKLIEHFPKHVKDLSLKEFRLMSFRLEPAEGNSFMSDQGFEGSIGYSLPEVDLDFSERMKVWLVVLEYQFVFGTPNEKINFSFKVDVVTLLDGTILYEYPGMGYCGD